MPGLTEAGEQRAAVSRQGPDTVIFSDPEEHVGGANGKHGLMRVGQVSFGGRARSLVVPVIMEGVEAQTVSWG